MLVPPSVVDGKRYTVEDDCEPAELPECISEALAAVKAPERKADQTGGELDTPYNVELAKDYLLNRAPVAIEGEGGDDCTVRVGMAVRDYGISEDTCLMLMAQYWNERCLPPWDLPARCRTVNAP